MAKRYSRLELKLPPALKMMDFSFKFIIKNSSTDKVVYVAEGEFDAGGFTKWFEIMQVNRTLYYEIYQKNRQTNKDIKVQTVLAKAYEKPNNWSLYAYKVSSGTTKKEKENIKEIYLNNGEVAWYLIKSRETATSWARKVYKNQLTVKDWEILKQNNPHIPQFDSKATLTPGQVIILSNSTTAKELPEYKRLAKEAHKNLEKMVYGEGVNAQFFAQNYEFFYDALIGEEYVGVSYEPIQSIDGRGENIATYAKNTVDGALILTESSKNRTLNSYSQLIRNYALEKNNKTFYANSKHFDKFKAKNLGLFKDFESHIAKTIFEWDTKIKTPNLRRHLQQTAFVKGKSYQGGLTAYSKHMNEVGRITKVLRQGGNFMIGVGVAEAGINIYQATETGDQKKIRKAVIVEPLKLGGSIYGGAKGAAIGGAAAVLVIGVGTGGLGLVVIGACAVIGGLGGGILGGEIGEIIGTGIDTSINKVIE